MNNIMLDLETMGNTSNSAIIAIGAVRFDDIVVDKFYEVVDLESSIEIGLEMSPDTVMWWMEQGDTARGELRKGHSIKEVLHSFSDWVGGGGVVWGNGVAFDNVILTNAYKKAGIKIPWRHWDDRCYRTVKNLHKEIKLLKRVGTLHCAVDDAESQALHLIQIFSYLKRKGIKL